jgi:hypothetical protein
MPTTTDGTGNLGPGTLTIGEVGSEVDASCLVNSAKITPSKSSTDPTTKLCGTVKKGSNTYTYALSGNVDVDAGEASGLFALCQSNAGGEVPFTFVPSTDVGTTATGTIVLDPLEFGGDEYGSTMVSDFEFSLVGPPVYAYGSES